MPALASEPQARIRVAVVEPVGGHGGMDYYDFGLCGGLAKVGVRAVLYTCDETDIPGEAGFELKRWYREIYGAAPRWLRALRFLRGGIRSLCHAWLTGAQVAHFHFFHVGPLEFFHVVLAKLLRIRVVVTAHDVEAFAEGLSVPRLARRAYAMADRVVAHNTVSHDELVSVLDVPPRKIVRIPHGNYLDHKWRVPSRADARARLGLAPEGPVLLFFGQVKRVKGLDLLLQALPSVIAAYPGVRLVIAGKIWKDDVSRYTDLITQLGLNGHCLLRIEYIPTDQVPDYFAAADLVVLPYRRIYQSGVLLMAMTLGTGVLASDLPGMREIVRDAETGFLFPAGNVQALAEHLVDVLADPVRVKGVATRALEYVREQHDWTAIGQRTAECYASVSG